MIWPEPSEACRRMETRRCPVEVYGTTPCGDRPCARFDLSEDRYVDELDATRLLASVFGSPA